MTSIDLGKSDKLLNLLDRRLRIVFYLEPLNFKSERKKFFRLKNYNPQFRYPQLAFSLDKTKRLLNKIKTDQTALGLIFAAKKQEFAKMLLLLKNIGRAKKFSQASILLYGQPQKSICQKAESIIAKTKQPDNSISPKETALDQDLKKIFDKIFKQLDLNWQTKIIKTLLSRLSTQYYGHSVKIKKGIQLNKKEVKCLINHELIHILRHENGRRQPYKIFSSGLANYLVWEEGLACYNESRVDGCFNQRLWSFALRTLAVNHAQEHSFYKTYHQLTKYGALPETAWQITTRVKRGLKNTALPGAFTKDHLYLQGYFLVKEYLQKGKPLNDLMMGKISPGDLKLIKKIPAMKEARYVLE